MVRIAKRIDPRRIADLKQLIGDKRYMDFAIHRLAQAITDEIVSVYGEGDEAPRAGWPPVAPSGERVTADSSDG